MKYPANLVSKRNFLKSFDIIICGSDETDFEKRLLNTSDITIIELKELVKAPYKKNFTDSMVETKVTIRIKNIGEELIIRNLYRKEIQGEATVQLCLTPLRKEIQEHITTATYRHHYLRGSGTPIYCRIEYLLFRVKRMGFLLSSSQYNGLFGDNLV